MRILLLHVSCDATPHDTPNTIKYVTRLFYAYTNWGPLLEILAANDATKADKIETARPLFRDSKEIISTVLKCNKTITVLQH